MGITLYIEIDELNIVGSHNSWHNLYRVRQNRIKVPCLIVSPKSFKGIWIQSTEIVYKVKSRGGTWWIGTNSSTKHKLILQWKCIRFENTQCRSYCSQDQCWAFPTVQLHQLSATPKNVSWPGDFDLWSMTFNRDVKIFASRCLRGVVGRLLKHAKLWMAITSKPFIRFTSFNFWLVGLDALYHFIHVADALTPINRRIAAAGSFWHPCFKLDLYILPPDLHAKIQVCMSVRLASKVVTHGQTHDVKTITPVTDTGCKKSALQFAVHNFLVIVWNYYQ